MAGRFKLPSLGAADLLAAPASHGTDGILSLLSPPPGGGEDLGLTPPPSFSHAPASVPSASGDPLVRTLQKAGFKGDALRTAWAIAKRESGGRADAYNPDRSTGDDSYGLFQINMLGGLGPARRKAYGLKSNQDLLDPETNARVAYAMSKGGKDFGAWGIGPNAYRKMPALDFTGYPGASKPPPPAKVTTAAPTFQASADPSNPYLVMTAPPPVGKTSRAPVDRVMEGDNLGARAVRVAASQLGKPYVFGSGPDASSFDCSDLVQYAYRQLGIEIPRDTWGQQRALPLKSWADLKPGDPIYRKSGGHVVIYAGNGKVIAAPHTGTVVQYQSLANFPPSGWEVRSIT